MSEVLLDPNGVGVCLARISAEIAERARDDEGPLVLIAIRRGGDPLATRIARAIDAIGATSGHSVPVVLGAVDVTLYRDDAATALPNPRIGPSRIPIALAGRRVVLVDDVLHTGRTIRAAFDAVLDYGRPRRIELAVLIDRGGRELPIQPDYVGLRVDVPADRRVEVVGKRIGPEPGDVEPWAIVVPSPTPAAAPSQRSMR
jgi:pyrimidine operon attenuation protein / uracil phosphoribosyltransferase